MAWLNLSADVAAEFDELRAWSEADADEALAIACANLAAKEAERVQDAYRLRRQRFTMRARRADPRLAPDPSQQAIWRRAYRARHLAAGLCRDCPRPAAANRSQCETCLVRRHGEGFVLRDRHIAAPVVESRVTKRQAGAMGGRAKAEAAAKKKAEQTRAAIAASKAQRRQARTGQRCANEERTA